MTQKKTKTKIKKTGKTFTGLVLSAKMQDTIVISLDYKYRHPIYKKTVRKRHKIYAQNNLKAKIGDLVMVKECRPLSKTKRFTTLEILKPAKA